MQRQLEIDFASAVLLFLSSLISSCRNAILNILQTGFFGERVALFVSMLYTTPMKNVKDQKAKQKLQRQENCNLIHNASIL